MRVRPGGHLGNGAVADIQGEGDILHEGIAVDRAPEVRYRCYGGAEESRLGGHGNADRLGNRRSGDIQRDRIRGEIDIFVCGAEAYGYSVAANSRVGECDDTAGGVCW